MAKKTLKSILIKQALRRQTKRQKRALAQLAKKEPKISKSILSPRALNKHGIFKYNTLPLGYHTTPTLFILQSHSTLMKKSLKTILRNKLPSAAARKNTIYPFSLSYSITLSRRGRQTKLIILIIYYSFEICLRRSFAANP